jgi:predicted amidohydrolase YtcJ
LGAATTIVNAKVFDGTKSQNWTSVRFADGLITKCSVVSAAQTGDEVIDAGGGTVLAGLIDAHVHLVPGALAQSLTFGVTTVLDAPSSRALPKLSSLTLSTSSSPRSWQPCANAGPTDARKAS